MADVEQPGNFFIAGVLEIPMPRVEVPGAGVLSFPIPPPQIEAMLHHAKQAPYGRGRETIVDTSVRNVWQIAPEAGKIGGKSRSRRIRSMVRATSGRVKRRASAQHGYTLFFNELRQLWRFGYGSVGDKHIGQQRINRNTLSPGGVEVSLFDFLGKLEGDGHNLLLFQG